MTTEVDVTNAALARLSLPGIGAFTDNSMAARTANRLYPIERDLVLAARDWSFATAYAVLVTAGTAPYPWTQQWAFPADAIRIRTVIPGSSASENINGEPLVWEEASDPTLGKVLRTQQTPATAVYTRRVTVPDLWEAGFLSAMTVQLAAALAIPLTGNGQLAQAMRAAAQEAIANLMPGIQATSVAPQPQGSRATAARG